MLRDNYKILVVDDNYSVIIFLKRLLRSKFMIEAISAPNGLLGLKELEENKIAGIILDISMPVMNGIQFLENIKEKEEFNNIPVLVLTAHGDKNTVTRLSQFKPDDFIVKPLALETSLKRLNTFINMAKLYICDYSCGLLVFNDSDKNLLEFFENNKIPYTIPDSIEMACDFVRNNMPKAILLGPSSDKFKTEEVIEELEKIHHTKWKHAYTPSIIGMNVGAEIDLDIKVNSHPELLKELHRIFCGITPPVETEKKKNK